MLNDGSLSRAAMGDQSDEISMTDVSLEDTVLDHRFSLKTIIVLGSNRLLLLLIWDKNIKVERVHTRIRPSYPKADLPLFHKCLDNSAIYYISTT